MIVHHEEDTVLETPIKRSWARAMQPSRPVRQSGADQINYITLQQSEPFEHMGDMMSSRRFWRQVDQIGDGWLCQDSTGVIGASKVPKGTSLEESLIGVMGWSRRNDITPRLVVLVSRGEATSHLIERRLHKMSAGLRKGRWINVRLCVVTRSDLLYVRKPPQKTVWNDNQGQRKIHESPT